MKRNRRSYRNRFRQNRRTQRPVFNHDVRQDYTQDAMRIRQEQLMADQMRLREETLAKEAKADRRAKRLAKQVLGKDFKKLNTEKYLIYKIKVKNGRKITLKIIYLFKDVVLYEQDPRSKRLTRICSLIQDPTTWNEVRYSIYDKLIAYYFWLRLYSRKPIHITDYKDQFNLLGYNTLTLEEVLRDTNPNWRVQTDELD